MKYLIDTNICIYIINNRFEGSSKWIKNAGNSNVFISSISIAELEFGISKSQRYEETQKALYQFISGYEIIDFDLNAAQEYGAIRSSLQKAGQVIGAMDMLIAATALSRKLVLVTNNEKEFNRIPGLTLENWVLLPP